VTEPGGADLRPSPGPGWYPDPDGAPGLVRWWNGVAWSDVATPAGPGAAVQSAPALTPPRREPEANAHARAHAPRQTPSGRFRTRPWIIGLSVLALVGALVLALVVGRSGDGTAAAGSPATAAPVPSGPTFAPGTVQIIDRDAGIAYPWLGENWLEWNLGAQLETTAITGEYFTTQANTPGGGIFIAQCTSGPLADGYGWGGDATLQTTLAAVADSVRGNYYPAPNDRRVLRDEDRTVDGHPARLFEFDLAWHVSGYDSTGERAALLLVDVGRPAPALLYISIPNTHAELYGVIDQVLDGVTVL
jgi:Protein of unknown function (DUF2510)